PAPADDFDEHTPPPRTRPEGEPVGRDIELPPGEPVALLFERWAADGRIPAGCVLGESTRDGYRLVAGAVAGCAPGALIPAAVLEPYQVRAVVRLRAGKFPAVPRAFAVFCVAPKGARKWTA
ncbi:MAG TPA: hypothetical protein VGE74_05820, partial [Gemmata sp.]